MVIVGIRGFGLSGCCGEGARSGKMAPIRAATLPRLRVVSPSCNLAVVDCAGEGRGLRSGLPCSGLGDVLRRTKAPFSLSTGEVGRELLSSAGAWRDILPLCGLMALTLRFELLAAAEAVARSRASM